MKRYRTARIPRRMSKFGVHMALEEYFDRHETKVLYEAAMRYFKENPKKTCWHDKGTKMKIRKYGEDSYTVEEA